MELSLLTLQARHEICNMRYTDIRHGYIYVVRDKTSGDSDMAFIRIKINRQLEKILGKTRSNSVASPYLILRTPDRRRRSDRKNKPHWTFVNPAYLTREFKRIPDEVGLFDHLEPNQRPTFHEMRSLASRLYVQQGFPKAYISKLMTHSDEKVTSLYLSGGVVSDDMYHEVSAELDLKSLKTGK